MKPGNKAVVDRHLKNIFISPVSPVFQTEATVSTNIKTSFQQQQQQNKLFNSLLTFIWENSEG